MEVACQVVWKVKKEKTTLQHGDSNFISSSVARKESCVPLHQDKKLITTFNPNKFKKEKK